MIAFTYKEELVSSIESMSPPLFLKSATLELPNNSDLINLQIIPTPSKTLPDTQPCSSTNSQPVLSILTTRHSPIPPPTNLQITIDNGTYTVPSKKKYNILKDPVFIDSSLLPPVLQPVKNPSQTNTMTDEFLGTHLTFKANLPSLYMAPITYKFRFPQDRNFDNYVAYA